MGNPRELPGSPGIAVGQEEEGMHNINAVTAQKRSKFAHSGEVEMAMVLDQTQYGPRRSDRLYVRVVTHREAIDETLKTPLIDAAYEFAKLSLCPTVQEPIDHESDPCALTTHIVTLDPGMPPMKEDLPTYPPDHYLS